MLCKVLSISAASCSGDLNLGGYTFACEKDSDCKAGQRCDPGAGCVVVTTGGDSLPRDTGGDDHPDAGPADTGLHPDTGDAGGHPDGAVDGGPSDTGAGDTGAEDIGPDAGQDTGNVDAGPIDTCGDASAADCGGGDAGTEYAAPQVSVYELSSGVCENDELVLRSISGWGVVTLMQNDEFISRGNVTFVK